MKALVYNGPRDVNCLRLPEDAGDKEDDDVMLSDIFPTGWHATRLANLQPSEF
jgi:glutathione-independent formaldehyde dehydrogenase